MEALLHVPTEDDKLQTLRVSLMDINPPAGPVERMESRSADSGALKK